MSPIKGMTDRRATFPQIGVIRKGAPKPEKGPGRDLEHFRVVFDEGEVNAAQAFDTLYGGSPTEINIMLPFDRVDRVWEAWREEYNASALVHRCDGEFVEYAINAKTGEVLVRNGVLVSEIPGLDLHLGDRVPCTGKANCKPTGRLTVVIPELRRAATLTVLTTSIHDIINISGQLEALKSLNNGRLTGLPLVLRRRPKRISTPTEDGPRVRRLKWLLSIEADPEWIGAKIAQLQGESYAQFTATSPYALIEEVEEVEETASAILPATTVREDIELLYALPRAVANMPEPEVMMEEEFDDFVTDLLRECTYYNHQRHIENTMRKLNLTWMSAASEAIWEALEEYAGKRADEKAATESGDVASVAEQAQERMPF